MSTYEYKTPAGVVIPSLDDVLAEVQAEWKSAFGEALDVSASTPQGSLIAADAAARYAVTQLCAGIANQLNPNQAGGAYLLALAALTGYSPEAAIYTKVPGVTLTGTPLAALPGGLVARSTGGDLFQTLQGVPVTLDASGGATVDFYAVAPGPIAVGIGELTEIVSGNLGWQQVNNTKPGIPGAAALTDSQIRAKRRETLAGQARNTYEAIYAQVALLDGIASVKMLVNPTSATASYAAVNLNNSAATIQFNVTAFSIWVCVYFYDGSITSHNSAVGTAILKGGSGPAYSSTATARAVSVEISPPEIAPQVIPVKFDYAFTYALSVEITIKLPIGSTATIDDIKKAVLAWAAGKSDFDAPGIGSVISPFTIGQAVQSIIGGAVTLVRLAPYSGTTPAWSTVSISTENNQIATFSTAGISVIPA